ncbi:cytochrome P460 family protein [Fimbriimonas ginsengisoli]|uniref:Cytochrome P460 domain-containing protein n=1 Tax=Fimbriimonas ginsengisoli Gsoil 348 TaxID=661478 RepID=A0A068NU41_FIMGI|nr:cytochrome P460 family protein [Fimbriimonas ginsengisoli]AIE86300.1 hypothetical protein OP10G_2932 [Fimbriimonas ginsengisoli Gsoil 348]
MRAIFAMVGCGVLAAGMAPMRQQSAAKDSEGVRQEIGSYRTWQCVTPRPVDMTPSIAMSCIGPATWDRSPNPHFQYVFKVYVNQLGKAALADPKHGPFPVGSIIVKEKYEVRQGQDRWRERELPKGAKPVLLTAMIKRPNGFDRANGDWQYMALSGDMKSRSTTGISYCSACHATQVKHDYVFGSYLPARFGTQEGRFIPIKGLGGRSR